MHRGSCCCASKRAAALSADVLPGGRCCQPVTPRACKWAEAASGGSARVARRQWRKADTYHHSSNLVDTYQRKYQIFLHLFFFPILHRYVSVVYSKRIHIRYVSDTGYMANLTYPCNVESRTTRICSFPTAGVPREHVSLQILMG